MKPHMFLFQGRVVPLPSVILNLFFVLHLLLVLYMADCMSSCPVDKAGSTRTPPPTPQAPFLNCFISFSEPKTRWQPSHLPGSLHSLSCHVCLVSYFSPFQAYSPSSIFLFFLNVIVKVFQWDDSKYVYINRGNTLGYILLIPVLCGLFISSLSLSFSPLWVQVRVISNLSAGSICAINHEASLFKIIWLRNQGVDCGSLTLEDSCIPLTINFVPYIFSKRVYLRDFIGFFLLSEAESGQLTDSWNLREREGDTAQD